MTSFFFNNMWSETDQSETSIMKLAYAKNDIIADKNQRNSFWFSRGLLIKARRLSYRLSDSVLWELQKFTIIQRKNSSTKL